MAFITSRGDDEACCNDGYHSGGGDDARVRQAASYEPERVTCSGRAWHAGLVVEVKAQRKGILELLVKNRDYTRNRRVTSVIACKCQLTLAPGLSVTQEKHRPNDRRGRDCNEP